MRPWLAEMIGTFFLVVASSGAAQMAVNETLVINLLAGALAVAGVLYVFITLFAPISGAHFNPAVSLAFWTQGALSTSRLGVYILAQCAGAALAAWSVHAMFSLPIFQIANPAPISFGLGLSEALMTSGLVFIILLGVAQSSKQIPAMVACFVGAGYFMSSSSTVANPAVTLARFLTDVPTTIGMPKALVFVIIQLASAFVIAKIMQNRKF